MKVLLDTSTFFWAASGHDRLSDAARATILDPANERFVSLASIWEMQVKHRLGKWDLPSPIHVLAPKWAESLDASLLRIELRHVGALYDLPGDHRDPFDRILVAQAMAEGMSVVSPDRVLARYPVSVIW